MKIQFKGSRGSTIVEAAMVFPLVMFITAGVILTGLRIYSSVRNDALLHRDEAQAERVIGTEDVLRGKWIFMQGINNEQEEELNVPETE